MELFSSRLLCARIVVPPWTFKNRNRQLRPSIRLTWIHNYYYLPKDLHFRCVSVPVTVPVSFIVSVWRQSCCLENGTKFWTLSLLRRHVCTQRENRQSNRRSFQRAICLPILLLKTCPITKFSKNKANDWANRLRLKRGIYEYIHTNANTYTDIRTVLFTSNIPARVSPFVRVGPIQLCHISDSWAPECSKAKSTAASLPISLF